MADDMISESENPLDPSPEVQLRIRERAYHLWDADGRPEGRDLEYWERARELEGMASSAGAGLKPIESASRPEEAEIQQNLGEFPDRFADQGERTPTPMTRAELDEQAARG